MNAACHHPSLFMLRIPLVALVLAVSLGVTPAAGHEFWIAPRDATPGPGETLVADLLQGEHFKGNPLRFNPAKFQRFAVIGPDGETPVASRLGDRPALSQAPGEPGLHVVVYVGRTGRTGYFTLASFADAAASEGYPDIVARHRARGLLETGFSEAYTRYAKALVRVGRDRNEPDRRVGLPIELVFEDMPTGEARVRAWLRGVPMAGAQIRVFSRSLRAERGAKAEEAVLRTDEEGRAVVTLAPGRRYLLSAVRLREPSATLARELDVVWETLWASTTFQTPD